jgi:hypothetical protein
VKVLVATKSVSVFERLRTLPDIEILPALTTEQIDQLIPSVQLAVVDFPDVVEYRFESGYIQTQLVNAQEKRGLAWTKGADFLADSDYWIEQASKAIGEKGLPKKRTVAFASYSGGVGKTSLALDMTLYFARQTEQPVLLIEFVYGASALASLLTELQMPFLYDLTTKFDLQPGSFKGVTLIPMDYDNCHMLPVEEIGKFLKRQMANHRLTVVDTIWKHGLIGSIQDEVDQWLVVTTPRLDAIENAKKLQLELGLKATVLLNQKRGAGDSLAMAGMERGLDLPYMDRVDQWTGKLGKDLLRYVYGPAWREYEKSENVFASLGRYLTGRRSAPKRT